ncbi:MAG: type II toxin-antitoxin system HipA family toxin [Gammaproteobacteria bacterium]|nr:MAG: type II toxin-antitoxin system HipA family toxin [Gammaproteobacteria bacterium]
MSTSAKVMLWGRQIGAVTWVAERRIGVFQYTPEFARSGIEVAPLRMPLSTLPREFPELPFATFHGLPGLLADSLPDKFGHALIDAWLARQGRTAESFDPVERLCYVGHRGMGALEFEPALAPGSVKRDAPLQIEALVELASSVLRERETLSGVMGTDKDAAELEDILRVGTSAGGARAKALVAWNRSTGEYRSGQLPSAPGFEQWLLKFDGVDANRDKELADPQGYGRIEYAYHLMAQAAGIDMTECRLHEEGGRAHFMTRRFDRTADGSRLHMQSLGALAHYDYNAAGAYSYEQALQVMLRLGLDVSQTEQQVRRTLFNVVARNQDDHVKNIAFLMDKAGRWRLAPAFDVIYSFNPDGAWTGRHQMTINGRRDDFDVEDLCAMGAVGNVKAMRTRRMLAEVCEAVGGWTSFAEQAGVPDADAARIRKTFRVDLAAQG